MLQLQAVRSKCAVLLYAPGAQDFSSAGNTLEAHGIDLALAGSVEKASDLLKDRNFDAILVAPGGNLECAGDILSEAAQMQRPPLIVICPECILDSAGGTAGPSTRLLHLLDSIASFSCKPAGEERRMRPSISRTGESHAGPHPGTKELGAELLAHDQNFSSLLHDLRTPIVAIRGYARMLLEGRAGVLNQVQQGYLSTVLQNAGRLIQLANDLDALRNTPPLNYSAVSLAALLLECRRRVSAERVVIEVDEAGAEDILVAADEEKLREAIIDVLANVLAFGGPETLLTIQLLCFNQEQAGLKIVQNGGRAVTNLDEFFAWEKRGSSETEPGWVRRIFWLHGCRVYLSRTPDDSSAIIVEFPQLLSRICPVDKTQADTAGEG